LESFPDYEVRCKYLFLVGDLGYPTKDSLREFFIKVAPQYEKVFVVAGNHEFYRAEYYETKIRLQTLCAEFPNFVWMDKHTLVIEEKFRIIGATLVGLKDLRINP
jgi:predicted phosphodiesterase